MIKMQKFIYHANKNAKNCWEINFNDKNTFYGLGINKMEINNNQIKKESYRARNSKCQYLIGNELLR